MNYIIFAGLLQVLLAIVFLVLNRQREKVDYLLILLLACIGWHLATKFYIFTTVDNPAVIFRMHTFIQLAYGPLLYIYTRKKNDQSFIPARIWYLFIPLIIVMTLYGCTSLAILKYPQKSNTILSIYNMAVFFPIVISHLVFGYLSPVKMLRNKSDKNDFQLITRLKYVLLLLGLTEIALFVLGNHDASFNPYIRGILYLLLSTVPILILWHKYAGNITIQTNSLKTIAASEPTIEQKRIVTSEPKERRFLLTDNQHQDIYLKLESLLQLKELYKDENLTLEKLSAASGINRHHISETLNVFAQKSFYQYINEYRVQEVLRKLDNDNKKKARLLSVAYDCGFKTKASFNQYFKSLTGKTPSGYLKEKAA